MLVLEFGGASAKLNNGGDTVRLYEGGVLQDEHTYPNTAEGKSHVRFPNGVGVWFDPIPTPGDANMITFDELMQGGYDAQTLALVLMLAQERGADIFTGTPETLAEAEPAPLDPYATTTEALSEEVIASSTDESISGGDGDSGESVASSTETVSIEEVFSTSSATSMGDASTEDGVSGTTTAQEGEHEPVIDGDMPHEMVSTSTASAPDEETASNQEDDAIEGSVDTADDVLIIKEDEEREVVSNEEVDDDNDADAEVDEVVVEEEVSVEPESPASEEPETEI
jgi:hypothetical protein